MSQALSSSTSRKTGDTEGKKYQFTTLHNFSCKATIGELVPIIKSLFVTHFGIGEAICDEILKKSFADYINQLSEGLEAFIEYPYVDRMYRDTYYHFYARKLRNYKRDTIRISFFKAGVKESDFLSSSAKTRRKIQNNYVGFLVLRPTFPQIIGRNILSREALKGSDYLTCSASFNITVNSAKLKLRGYPHASQDYQSIKCAETSLWAILEYFGNKFPDHVPVMPSKIHNILSNYSFKRLVPSDGLTGEQLGYALRELGFSPVIYSPVIGDEDTLNEEFNPVISVYIESGLPVLGLIGSEEKGHCVNIIGRENDDNDVILGTAPETLNNGARIIDYNNVPRKYIVMDDNQCPYGKVSLTDPCELYVDGEGLRLPGWENFKMDNVIVPLPHKVYLDAEEARFIFKNILGSAEYGLSDDAVYIVKIFIATSRTYKDYIAKGDMLPEVKEHFLHLPMSKFVYVAEISDADNFKAKKCNGILLLDATELSLKEEQGIPLAFLAGYNKVSSEKRTKPDRDGLFIRQDFGNLDKIGTFARPFETFRENIM